MLRVALVSFYDDRRSDEFPMRHSLSSMRLAAYLGKSEPTWKVGLRAFEQRKEAREIAADLVREGFDVIGLPAYIWTKCLSADLAKAVLAHARPLVVVGGPETRCMPLDSWPSGIIFTAGQGEEALLSICRSRAADGLFCGRSLPDRGSIPAFSTGAQRSVVLDQSKPDRSMLRLPHGLPLFCETFDRMLEADDEGVDFTWYETARGCIYTCSFCGHNTLPFFATFDLDFVEREICLLRERGVRRIFLIDPILGGRPARGKAILKLLRAHAPEIAITSYMRPEFLDAEFIDLLCEANLTELLIGLQTTNPSVPRHVRGNNLAKIERYLPELRGRGVNWRAELIVGLPGDTFHGLRESMRFAIDTLMPSALYAYHLTAIPETKLYDLVSDQMSPHWIEIDDKSQVVAARSYSRDDLADMLRYAGAMTSLFNQVTEDAGACAGFDWLERRVRNVLDASDLSSTEARSIFHPMSMTDAKAMWRARLGNERGESGPNGAREPDILMAKAARSHRDTGRSVA